MSEPQAYPLRLSPAPGESLRGYMHRFALRNAIPYINWIVTDLGPQKISTALTSDQMVRLSTMTGTPLEDLSDRQAIQDNGETLLLGQRVSHSMAEREASRLCLQCFQEEPYHRLIWDFLPVSVCPVHGTPITRQCPECGAVLHWRRNHLNKCPAGHALLKERQAAPIMEDPAPLAGVRAICARFGVYKSLTPASLPWSEQELPVWDLIEMLDLLGRLSFGTLDKVRRGIRRIYHSDGYHLTLSRGYHVASDWPRAFNGILDKQSASAGCFWLADSSHPVRKALHRELCRQERPYRQILGPEIWRYAEANGITLSAGAFGFSPTGFGQTFVSSTKARGLMQVSTEVLQRIARKEGWSGAGQLSTGKFVWLRRRDVDAWCQSHRNGISATKLARRFHTSQSAILAMAQLGLFGSKARDRRPAQLKARWHALPGEAQRFMDQLRGALTCKPEEGVDYVNWIGFTKRPESQLLKISDIVAGIIHGKVRAASMTGESLASLRFNLADALALARSALSADVSTPSEDFKLPLRKIKELYHIEHPFLMRAIALGLLPAEERRFGPVRFWISTSDMEDFLTRFTTIGLLARQFGKSAPSLWAALRHLNVHPYGSDGSNPGVPKLFALSDIHAAGLQRVVAACKNEKVRNPCTPKSKPPGVRRRSTPQSSIRSMSSPPVQADSAEPHSPLGRHDLPHILQFQSALSTHHARPETRSSGAETISTSAQTRMRRKPVRIPAPVRRKEWIAANDLADSGPSRSV